MKTMELKYMYITYFQEDHNESIGHDNGMDIDEMDPQSATDQLNASHQAVKISCT